MPKKFWMYFTMMFFSSLKKTFLPFYVRPFTTQLEVLAKYHQDKDEKGNVVGMCRPMSNVYLGLLLEHKNPSEYLAQDLKFLQEAIHEENREVEARHQGHQDLDHFVFEQHHIPHQHQNFSKSELTQEKFEQVLENKQHLLITYPTNPKQYHEVYLGKENPNSHPASNRCRFFDANIPGGERVGSCPEVIKEFIRVTKKHYTHENKPFSVGMSS